VVGPAPYLRWAGCCCLGSAHLHLEHPIPRHAFNATRSSDSAATPGEQASARAWAQFWAHSPPSATVHRCSLRSCSRSWRTVADAGERHATVLESVLGASPREFESRILRRADLRRRFRIMFTRCTASQARVSFLVSVELWTYVVFRTNRCGGTLEMIHVVPGQGRRRHI